MTDDEKIALQKEIDNLESAILKMKEQRAELRKKLPREPVKDYEFPLAGGGTVKLSELFGDRNELIIVHNMGKQCPYCTMWADGFNGVLHHLESLTAFALESPDAPEVQEEFAKSRGWKFRMLSSKTNRFKHEMGYMNDEGQQGGGASSFVRDPDGKLYRHSHLEFYPGDDFSSPWFFFELLPGGFDNWGPKFRY